jgi:phosphoserine phosphatase RsbU/P
MDRIAIAILLLYAGVRVLAALGTSVPFSVLFGFFAFLAIIYLIIRMVPWFRTKVMWPLRNRLIVAYVFIAVVPVILLLTMVGVASYLLYLELGAHLLHDDLQDRISMVSEDTKAISSEIEREAGTESSSVDESVLKRPNVANLIGGAEEEWPGLRVHLNRGQHLLAAGDGHHFAGLVESDGKLWFAAAENRDEHPPAFTLVLTAPVTASTLDALTKDLGPIQVILWQPLPANTPKTGATLTFQNAERTYIPGQQIASRTKALGPAANIFDIKVTGLSVFEATYMESGKEADKVPVLASFSLRPSALNGRLFSTVGAVGPLLITVLLIVGTVFLLLEIAALATGVVLTRTITRAVGDLYEATLFVRRGDFAKRVRVHQRDQVGALGESFNEMTTSISELIEEQRKRQRLENEIAIAQEVQAQLFPQSLPQLPGLQLAAICRPARVVSGDYYDFIRLGPNRLGIALADISGKGIFAALLMASLQAALRSTAMLDGHGGTAELVEKLNRHLFRNTSDDRYATFFYAVYDEEARTLTYTNAGHLAPFFVHDGKVQELEEGGTVVGLFEECPFTQGTIRVEPGSLLVLFSDGLTEPENVYGEEYGRQRLRAEILRQTNIPPQRLAENLIAAAEQWAGTAEQADDMTVVIARME